MELTLKGEPNGFPTHVRRTCAFAITGIVGIALDVYSITTYNFLSNVQGTPKAINVLANHIKTPGDLPRAFIGRSRGLSGPQLLLT